MFISIRKERAFFYYEISLAALVEMAWQKNGCRYAEQRAKFLYNLVGKVSFPFYTDGF